MIYDAFLFLNELDLLELRLHTLAPHVDKFILVESNQSFSTLSTKPGFVFEQNRHLSSEFADKIIYVKLDNEFQTAEQLSRQGLAKRLWHSLSRYNLADVNETWNRNAILRGLTEARAEDLVLVSDIDEVVDPACLPRAIEALKTGPAVKLEMKMYRYFVNNRQLGPGWEGARLTTCGGLRKVTPHGLRGNSNLPLVGDCGWHFSNVGGLDRLHFKIQSDLHHDRCFRGDYRDPEKLRWLLRDRVVRQGRDIFDFNAELSYRLEAIDDSYPVYLREHRERFEHLICPANTGEI